jgi:hypothetical protein
MAYNPNFRGANAKGSSRSLQTGYQNGTGSTLLQATPVSVNTSGQIILVDVTSDASVAGIVGVVAANTLPSANGLVLDCGRLENISTSFSIGDAIYIDTNGNLTNVRPSRGVGAYTQGDYVVFVGVIVQNEFNNTLVDLKVYMDVIGQL